MEIARYWMVHNVYGGGMPAKRHETREAATNEAQRLARGTHGHYFAVLEIIDCYRTAAPPVAQVSVVTVPPQQMGGNATNKF